MIGLEYLQGSSDAEYEKLAEPFHKEMDFAFFASNFGYSKADYNAITKKEQAFLIKAIETRIVSQTTLMYNAIYTAVYNAMRPKNKRALKLWIKPKTQRANMQTASENLRIVNEVEEKEGKGWIDQIYRANGMKRPERW